MDRPTFLKKGEPARLFPVLADSSKEGRASRKDVEPSAIAQGDAAKAEGKNSDGKSKEGENEIEARKNKRKLSSISHH